MRKPDLDRIDFVYNELCRQSENKTNERIWHVQSGPLESRAELHESEEFRARKKLPIYLNKLKQYEVYKQINIDKTESKRKTEDFLKAKNGTL